VEEGGAQVCAGEVGATQIGALLALRQVKIEGPVALAQDPAQLAQGANRHTLIRRLAGGDVGLVGGA
jgi:hypothetical protein